MSSVKMLGGNVKLLCVSLLHQPIKMFQGLKSDIWTLAPFIMMRTLRTIGGFERGHKRR